MTQQTNRQTDTKIMPYVFHWRRPAYRPNNEQVQSTSTSESLSRYSSSKPRPSLSSLEQLYSFAITAVSLHFYPRDAIELVMRGIDYGRISVCLSCHKPVLRNEWMNQAQFGTDVEPSLTYILHHLINLVSPK